MSDIFTNIVAAAENEAEKTMLEVEVLAQLIAEKMQHLDGERYRVDINHDRGFVVVRAS